MSSFLSGKWAAPDPTKKDDDRREEEETAEIGVGRTGVTITSSSRFNTNGGDNERVTITGTNSFDVGGNEEEEVVENSDSSSKETKPSQAGTFTMDRSEDTFDEEYQQLQEQAPSGCDSTDKKKKEEQPLVEETEYKPKEVQEEDKEQLLTEDAYSLLFTSPPCSTTALFAWFAILLQGGMLLVTFLDLFDTSPEGNDTNGEKNRMELKVGSTEQVMIAQFLGMLVTALTMAAEGDFVIGITQLINGYDPRIREKCPHASWPRWLFTGLLQSIVGLLLLFDSFILSMQSATVIDLSMNLTALYFIQEIDNQAFTLALETGLLGRTVKEDCERVQNCHGHSTPSDRKRALHLRRCLIAVMTIGLLAPYFLVIFRQRDGYYMCKFLYIQFGDEYTPDMAHYSGIFKNQGNGLGDRKGQRPYYVDNTGTYQVAFCDADNYWTISKVADDRPCDFIYRSAETDTFDIIEAADMNWYVNTPASGVIDADWLTIVCNECTTDTCNPEFGVCSEDGSECLCNTDDHWGLKRFGLNCQFEEKCRTFALDKRTIDGLAAIPGTSSFLDREYVSLYWDETPMDTPRFYGFPVYIPYDEGDQVDSFIIFSGRRWILYAIPDENLARVVEIEKRPSNWTKYEFEENFDDFKNYPSRVAAFEALTASLLNYYPIFFSSPLNHGEDFSHYEPSTVKWMAATTPYKTENPLIPASPDESQPVPAKFLCTDCTGDDGVPNHDMCLNGGYCSQTSDCVCPTYYTGYQCERVKDCIGIDECGGGGKCNKETKTCDCEEGSYGNLCQLGLGAVPDQFLCSRCKIYGHGECNSTFSQECTCDEGYGGKYCNETLVIVI